ncbi:MAG: hypothetical protein O3B87_04370 [bacterium]|nr:hypothetical protein [bacterium]
MKNWSTNTKRLKQNIRAYTIWKLEQMINFGLNNHKLSLKALKKYWNTLEIDPNKRNFLKKIVWPQS